MHHTTTSAAVHIHLLFYQSHTHEPFDAQNCPGSELHFNPNFVGCLNLPVQFFPRFSVAEIHTSPASVTPAHFIVLAIHISFTHPGMVPRYAGTQTSAPSAFMLHCYTQLGNHTPQAVARSANSRCTVVGSEFYNTANGHLLDQVRPEEQWKVIANVVHI